MKFTDTMKIALHRLRISKTFFTYCVIGATSAVIDFSGLIIGVEILRFPLILANSLSFSAAVINSFYWHRRITFRNTHPRVLRQFFVFVACATLGVAINNAVLFFMAEIVGVWYVFGKAVATGIALLWNYSINKRFIFAK
ncbi:MAG: GtrA family protein [Candidatus Jacksonbacteria bacterium]|nr:GtrA family protein [Candidatus Jacksonbacteria bacterium]